MIRTLVAEPTTLIQEGIVALLGREGDIELIAAVRSAREAIGVARALQPDVALLAAAFPAGDGPGARGSGGWSSRAASWTAGRAADRDGDGIAVAAAIRAAAPACRCAILSLGWRPEDVDRAATADVRGLLACDAPAEHLTSAVRRLAAGGTVIDPRLASTAQSPLTARESAALRVAAQGLTTAEIASTLGLTEGTVRNYLSRAIAKTGARNRIIAIRIADQAGWI